MAVLISMMRIKITNNIIILINVLLGKVNTFIVQ